MKLRIFALILLSVFLFSACEQDNSLVFIEEVNEIKRYLSENTLSKEITRDNTTYKNFHCIAAIPEKDIYLYGLNDGFSMLLYFQGKYSVLDYYWLTPRQILPKMFLHDYGSGEETLAIIVYQASGTGVSVWSLLMVEVNGEAERYDDIFYRFKHKLLSYNEISDMLLPHIEKPNEFHLTSVNSINIENQIIINMPIYLKTNVGATGDYTGEYVFAEFTYSNNEFHISRAWIESRIET